MAGLQFPVALVRLKNDFYVIVSTKDIIVPNKKNIASDNIDRKFESICLDLWGEGTAFRTITKSQNNFKLHTEIEKFSNQIKIYEHSCEATNEKNEIVYNEEGENNMKMMGLPFIYTFEDKKVLDELYFVMTADMFEERFMPEVNKVYPLGFTSFNVISKISVVKKISEIVCYKLKE